MKLSILSIAALSALASAAPAEKDTRQVDFINTTSDDLLKGSCKKVLLIFARASTEVGNMVRASLYELMVHSTNS